MNAGVPARLGFEREARIKQGRDFLSLRQGGERLSCGGLLVNWRVHPDRSLRRLGVITSRKLGGAVVRNRARRLIREVYRVHQHELRSGLDMVVIARASIVGKDFAGVEKDFLVMAGRAGIITGREDQA